MSTSTERIVKKTKTPTRKKTGTKRSSFTQEEEGSSAPYIYAVGRRKTSVAQVRLFPEGTGTITINTRPLREFFPTFILQEKILLPLKTVGKQEGIDCKIKVTGGGTVGQAQAVSHGIARALVRYQEEFRKSLKSLGLLTRDSREKERKKPGLKRARKAPQWSKR